MQGLFSCATVTLALTIKNHLWSQWLLFTVVKFDLMLH